MAGFRPSISRGQDGERAGNHFRGERRTSDRLAVELHRQGGNRLHGEAGFPGVADVRGFADVAGGVGQDADEAAAIAIRSSTPSSGLISRLTRSSGGMISPQFMMSTRAAGVSRGSPSTVTGHAVLRISRGIRRGVAL